MKKIYFILAFLLIHTLGYSQQDPQYTQYMYNMNVVNPAYTTNNLGIINVGALYRSQWKNAVGSPETLSFFTHIPVTNKIETGISFITDKIGDGVLKENNIYADFSYTLKLNKNNNLALGLKAGFTNFETNFNGFVLPEFQDDNAFNENSNTMFPNIGIGAFYNTNNWYVGASAPNLLNTKHLESNSGISAIGSEKIHVFFTGGYVYELNRNLKIKPSFLMKAVGGAPLSIDGAINVLFNNKFEGGISYRVGDAISGLFNIKATPMLRIGYAYDYTLSNLGNFNAGTHEIFVLFDLDLFGLKKGYDKSPRFY